MDQLAKAKAELERRKALTQAKAELERRKTSEADTNNTQTWNAEQQAWVNSDGSVAAYSNPEHTLSKGKTRGEQFATNIGEGINRVVEGATFGIIGDEANAAADAFIGRGEGETFKERYNENLDKWRRQEAEFKAQNPKTALALETAGAIGSSVVTLGTTATTLGGATTLGAVVGGTQSFAEGEGGFQERLKDGAVGAATGALFGAASKKVVDIGSAAFKRVFAKTAERPTVEGMKALKKVAYDAVDSSGEKFTSKELSSALTAFKEQLETSSYVPEVDKQTFAVLRSLTSASKRDLTISQLDELRKGFYKRFNTAPNEVGILKAVDVIDDLIASKSSTNEMMQAARLAHSRFKKTEMLDLAFQKAQDQTSATGSGGNVLNKMRQAVVSIVNNPQKAKWFSEEEVALMRQFSQGSVTENTLRKIGKLSPDGNGLMMALNLMAVSVNPTMIAVSGGATGAKALADRSAMKGAETLIESVATGTLPKTSTSTVSGALAPATASSGNRLLEIN